MLALTVIAVTLIVIIICISYDLIPSSQVLNAENIIRCDINSSNVIQSKQNNKLGMYNLSVHKNLNGYSGLIRGCTWNGCLENNNHPVFSYPYYITLDNNGVVSSLDLIDLDYFSLNKCDKAFNDVYANGIEDPKLFLYKDEEWCIGSSLGSKHQLNPCINSMCIFKIINPQDTFKILTPPSWVNPDQRQKNWSPFEWNGKLLCEYTINPHVILEINPVTGVTDEFSRSGSISDDITQLTSMRGGAPPIRINDKIYLGIGHTHPSKSSGYVHFFYIFESSPPFKIINISKTFKMDAIETIQFAAGISLYDDYIYVSYGVNDCSNRISRYKLNDILSTLKYYQN